MQQGPFYLSLMDLKTTLVVKERTLKERIEVRRIILLREKIKQVQEEIRELKSKIKEKERLLKSKQKKKSEKKANSLQKR
ncbi:hypothetical protein MHLP_02195 [Candidatus Mycoplasma haematolamae str. Purdue]|uniref:Uncharacterized protein n=1 Tax=Mycoplasma haematolamae (strain Purdue) TaxID=1212765 RepID=I7CJI9_MYCHA|nr:hypothetical protein MHLP_02195 [Candidatus Mycoplasma haematolamae str. Purdue]